MGPLNAMTTFSQKFLRGLPEDIPVREYSRRHAGMAAVSLNELNAMYVGMDVKRSADGLVNYVALATPSQVLLISTETGKQSSLLTFDQPFKDLLAGDSCTLVGFDMARLALQLSDDLKLSVRGVDLSTIFAPNLRNPWQPSKVVAATISPPVNNFELDALWNNDTPRSNREVCLRAWISACTSRTAAQTATIENALKVDTALITVQKERVCLRELVRQACLLEDARPKEMPNEFSRYKVQQDGTLDIQNSRYRTRVRRGNQTVIMTNETGQEFTGRPHGAKGKSTSIAFTNQRLSGTLQKVRVVGRPEPTNSERAREELLLLVLQGQVSLRQSIFIRKLWFPSQKDRSVGRESHDPHAQSKFPLLNPSQAQVASAMISSSALVIAHGPPGTGKTRTIAHAAEFWERNRDPAWIIAHSNVAVKNIAETLYKQGVDFKILVSKEFHLEWHEHIYEMIHDKLLRSDDFAGIKDIVGTERLLGGSCIMLSTLSMLSNPAIDKVGVFRLVPVARLVVDEASQIRIDEFMHVFHNFSRTLEKVSFFGDPKQLPPFGQDKVPQLKTIFDIEYLSASAGFLDIQYRLPVPIGHFISRYVYQGKLKSEHDLKHMLCVSFVDVSKGEESKSGFSWRNDAEIQVMAHLVRTYYKYKNFCIITPYDAQRAAIEKQLKEEGLPWEHVFNVDSFQGNEADFVLVSVVRSGREPGFLSSLNRMNVMLTRCRRGLVVVTNRSFLQGGGRYTLLGALERHWMDARGDAAWVDWKSVAEGKADLPSAPGPKRDQRPPFGSSSFQYNAASVSGAPSVPQKKFDTKALFRRPVAPSAPSSLTSTGLPPATKAPHSDTRPGPVNHSEWQTVQTSKARRRPREVVTSFSSAKKGQAHTTYGSLLTADNKDFRTPRKTVGRVPVPSNTSSASNRFAPRV